jgi:3-deoxy-7-phosphoheptulonate synthase
VIVRLPSDLPTARLQAYQDALAAYDASLKVFELSFCRLVMLRPDAGQVAALAEEISRWEGAVLYSSLPEYPLASREVLPQPSRIPVGDGLAMGENEPFAVIAGPCAIESEAQIEATARHLYQCGIKIIRGGAYKPRTSPYSFQGLGDEGLRLISSAARRHHMRIITELMDLSLLEAIEPHTDIIQVGTRNMSNFSMLKELGRQRKPVLLKRGMSATVREWLLAAEYILSEGNPHVILCERGIRTFDTTLRNTFDLAGISVAKDLTHLPVIADPSHGTGRRRFVPPMALASLVAGADGVMFEVHPNPSSALSDGEQSLDFEAARHLIGKLLSLAPYCNRSVQLREGIAKSSNVCVE